MFNVIPLILIFISVALIIFIILRKFPQLSSIKTETIRSEKESGIKNKILDERIKRKSDKAIKFFKGIFFKVGKVISNKVESTKEALEEKNKELEMEEEYNGMLISKEDYAKKEEIIELKLEEAEKFADIDNFEKAESKFIEVISKDPKNIDAYEGLGELYVENKMFNEAMETYSYILKLNPKSAKTHFEIFEIHAMENKFAEGIVHLKKAHDLENKNPKYISALVELYIKQKDKINAQLMVQKLKDANPDNASIMDYVEKLENL